MIGKPGDPGDARSSTDLKIGKRITSALREARLDEAMLSRQMEIEPSLLQAWCRGEMRIAAKDLVRLAQLVDKPVVWFFKN